MAVRILVAIVFFHLSWLPAQVRGGDPVGDPRALRINEILASNRITPPADVENEFEDLIEIYNPLPDQFVLLKDLVLANAVSKDVSGNYHPVNGWKFTGGSLMPGSFISVFCDGEVETGSTSQPHVSFRLDQDGELIALFTATEELIDMIVFPWIPEGISYGRSPDGAGPSPALGADPSLGYFPAPTFKSGTICNPSTGGCTTAGNGTCGNIAPEVDFKPIRSLAGASAPYFAPHAPVFLLAKAWDENPGGVADVAVIFSVDGGDDVAIEMALDAEQMAALVLSDPLGPPGATKPDPNSSIWTASIPGQPEGSIVTFRFRATDTEGASSTDPKVLCPDGYVPPPDCHRPFRYKVSHGYMGPVMINEVCLSNFSVLRDTTDFRFESYIELYSSEDLDLSGMWLSTNPFRPADWALPDSGTWTLRWRFPPGSSMRAGEHLLVWCDDDESRTNPAMREYHTNFNLGLNDVDEDERTFEEEVFLFDTEANGSGLIDAFLFGRASVADVAFSRCPDGTRDAAWKPILLGSPKLPNLCDPKFLRGDPDVSTVIDLADVVTTLEYLFVGGAAPPCLAAADANDTDQVDIADPIYLLEFLFLGGPAPPAPFPDCGTDPISLGCRIPSCD
jgi:hypothetical protein